MPGLSQIKKFSSDLLAIGDEVSLRASRGEKPVSVEIPKTVEDKDDSEDFVLGMPEIEAEKPEELDDDLSDLTNLASPSKNNTTSEDTGPAFAAPDLSSLLNPINVPDDAAAGADMPDLSMFEDEPEQEEQVEEEPEEISVGDMDLDALLAGGGFDQTEEQEEEAESEAPELDMSATEDVPDIDAIDDLNNSEKKEQLEDIPDLGDDFDASVLEDVQPADDLTAPADDFSAPLDDLTAPADDLTAPADDFSAPLDDLTAPTEDFSAPLDDLTAPTDDLTAPADDFSVPLDDLTAPADDFSVPLDDLTAPADDLTAPTDDFSAPLDDLTAPADDFSAPLDDLTAPADDFSVPLDDLTAPADDFSVPLDDLTAPTDDLTAPSDDFSAPLDDLTAPADDFSAPLDDLTAPADDLTAPADDFSVPLDDLTAPTDDFSAPLDDLTAPADDFSVPLDDLTAPTDDLTAPADDFSVPLDDLTAPADDFSAPLDDLTAPTDDFSAPLDDLTAPADDLTAPTDDFSFEDKTEEKQDTDTAGSLDELEQLDDLDNPEEPSASDDFNINNLPDMDESMDNLPDLDEDFAAGKADENSTSSDNNEENASSLNDFSDFNFDEDTNPDAAEGGESPADNLNDGLDTAEAGDDFGIPEETAEVFDTSDMEGLDFNIPETDSQMDGDSSFEMGNNEDFAMDSDFEIPGFSDVETAKEEPKEKQKAAKGKKGRKEELDEPDFSDAMEGDELPPNTLSDEQYKTFTKNLSEYPLNVRLAIENLIVQDEFTDDAEFEVIEKVLNKAPARSVAAMLEKMLDISIPVPRDFEHRTAEEYEAYKKSISYQLRNRIIPAFFVCVAALLLCWGLFNFGKNCIFKPLKAISLYKQGYNLLQADEYPQSEMKFNQAVKYRLNKKWFFNYARGYREHKQYQRSENMYENILYCFKHDKEAGLEYADMELNDLANYQKAEEIVRRDVLDYHINDADGILLLGDIFLEWGTEKDPEKLELARQQYATLLQLYKANDLYLSRMMRYFVRTDNLRQVLQLKPNFEGREKSLSWQDWTELSGYLLDKMYGPLPAADEYLRNEIDGLRGLLLQAAKSNPENPVAQYNLGRYFILSNELERVEATLQKAILNFNNVESIKNRDIYKYIDSYKLLGEYYKNKTEYLQAQEQYAEGINLYTTERDNAGFKGNVQIGKLYEDLGDINYFVSGDYDDALLNYTSSVELENDNPSIRYKIGYIQYKNKKYQEALGSFMKAGDGNIKEKNLMLSMANTLSLRGDDYAADGYYDALISRLDDEIADKGLVLPQANLKDNNLVTQYLYAANNYGVTLYRLAKRTGNSSYNAQSIVQFQQSVRAWDALTRNQNTLVRLGGSNLAEQNIQYITHKVPDFEPEIYVDIPKTLTDEEHL